jgi:hypothetical protein
MPADPGSPARLAGEHSCVRVAIRSYHDGEIAAAHRDEKRLERDGCRVINGDGLAVEVVENPRNERLWRGRLLEQCSHSARPLRTRQKSPAICTS